MASHSRFSQPRGTKQRSGLRSPLASLTLAHFSLHGQQGTQVSPVVPCRKSLFPFKPWSPSLKVGNDPC